MRPLAPLSEAHRGGLHVRGYDGSGPITHMLHLVQMSTTALPDLGRLLAGAAPGRSGHEQVIRRRQLGEPQRAPPLLVG